MKTKILEEILKDIKNIKNIKNIIHIRDKKRFVLQNLPYLFFFYSGNIFFAHIGRYVDGDIVDKIFQGILDIGDINPIPSLDITDIFAGLIFALIVKLIVHTKMKNAKKFRQGKEYGSARWSA